MKITKNVSLQKNGKKKINFTNFVNFLIFVNFMMFGLRLQCCEIWHFRNFQPLCAFLFFVVFCSLFCFCWFFVSRFLSRNVCSFVFFAVSATACPFLGAPVAVVQRPTKFQTQLCQLVVEVGWCQFPNRYHYSYLLIQTVKKKISVWYFTSCDLTNFC